VICLYSMSAYVFIVFVLLTGYINIRKNSECIQSNDHSFFWLGTVSSIINGRINYKP